MNEEDMDRTQNQDWARQPDGRSITAYCELFCW